MPSEMPPARPKKPCLMPSSRARLGAVVTGVGITSPGPPTSMRVADHAMYYQGCATQGRAGAHGARLTLATATPADFKGLIQSLISVPIFFVLLAVLEFWPAGTLQWARGWWFLA